MFTQEGNSNKCAKSQGENLEFKTIKLIQWDEVVEEVEVATPAESMELKLSEMISEDDNMKKGIRNKKSII